MSACWHVKVRARAAACSTDERRLALNILHRMYASSSCRIAVPPCTALRVRQVRPGILRAARTSVRAWVRPPCAVRETHVVSAIEQGEERRFSLG